MITDEQVEALALLHDPDCHRAKFCLDAKSWERIGIDIARGLDLDRPPRKVILDLGCGFGYFVRVCRQWGHEAMGVEMDDATIEKAAGILNVPILMYTIQPFKPLPPVCGSPNIVTMFGVNLHDGAYWTADKYAHLAQNIRSRLTPGGKWVIQPNVPPDVDSPTACQMSISWWQHVAGEDAIVSTTTNHSFQVTIQWQT